MREARRRAGLTQSQLAARMGTTQSVIARWETGWRSPTFATVERALRECGLALSPRLVPLDTGPLGVASAVATLTPRERLDANRRLISLAGIARRPRSP